jgi:hypothetical protein
MKNTIIILTLSFLAISCEKNLYYDPADFPPMVVINAIIGADSTVRVYAEKSVVSAMDIFLGKTDTSNFTVELFANNEYLEQLIQEETSYALNTSVNNVRDSVVYKTYNSKHIAKSNNSYQLRISHPNFKAIHISTSIPDKIEIFSADTLFYRNQLNHEPYKLGYQITFSDPAAENYYQLVCNTLYGKLLPNTHDDYKEGINQVIIFDYYKTQLTPENMFFKTGTDANDYLFGSPPNQFNVFNDATFNGKTCTIDLVSLEFNEDFNHAKLDTANGEFFQIEAYLLHITKELYLYLKSADEQIHNSNNPLFEPTIVFSNIKNGTGILGAYAADKVKTTIGSYPKNNIEYLDQNKYWFFY